MPNIDSSYTTSGAYNYAGSFIDFGNGQSTHMSYPGLNVTITYTPGTYTAWLNVVDSMNTSCQDSMFVTFTINNTTTSCQAGFTIFQDSLNIGNYYGYNTSVTNPSYTTTYTWNWGDSTMSTGQYPSHTYADSGFYNICLYISSMGGGAVCQDTFCLTQFIAKVGNINNIHSFNKILKITDCICTDPSFKFITARPNFIHYLPINFFAS